MAPKEPFKVHSLSKHIEDTNKGLSADAQYNRRRPAPVAKKVPKADDAAIFANDDDSDDDSSSSGSSDGEGGAEFLKKLSQPGAKTAAPSASKRADKDVEIADSDAERNKRKKAKSVEDGSESSDESASDSEPDGNQPKAKANGAAVAKAAPSSGSSSETSDSDSSDENEAPGAEKPATGEIAESSGSETSDSGSDSGGSKSGKGADKVAVNGQVSKTATFQTSSSSEKDGTSGQGQDKNAKPVRPTGETSSSSSSASSAESDLEMADESIHMEDRQHGGKVTPPKLISPDFVLRKSDDGTSGEDLARICSQANLQGKQLWYFTVPSGVPVSVVQNLEIPMDASQRGDSAFSHGGEEFGLSFDSMAPKRSIQIMIPSADGCRYQAATQQVEQVMQIRRITQLSADGSPVGPSESNAPRPQPKGLKARFQPIGVNTPMSNIGSDNGSDVEDCDMADAPALSTAPKSLPHQLTPKTPADKSTAKNKKDKRKDAAVDEAKQAAVPRSGKRKQPSSEDEAAAAASQLMTESQTAKSKTKKPKTGRSGSPDLGSELPVPDTTTKAGQTPVVPPSNSAPPSSLPALPSSLPGTLSASAAVTPTPASKPKKSKKAKGEQALPPSSQSLPSAKKGTPVPIPRQTAVPIPLIPTSSQMPKVSPVPVPIPMPTAATPVGTKGAKDAQSNDAAGDSPGVGPSPHASPPPSAQAPRKQSKKKKTASGAQDSKVQA